MDNPSREGKNVHAGDAYFCCLKSEKIGLLDLGVTGTGLTAGHSKGGMGKNMRNIHENDKTDPKRFLLGPFCLQSESPTP